MTCRPKVDKDFSDKSMFKNNIKYAITINTSDGYQYTRYQTPRRLKYACQVYYNIGRLLGQVSVYDFILEISQAGRIHAHGYITFHDSFEYYCHLIHVLKEVCNIKIVEIDDQTIWAQYLIKDRELMEPCLTKRGIPYRYSNKCETVKRWNKPLISLRQKICKEIKVQEESYRTSIFQYLDAVEEN